MASRIPNISQGNLTPNEPNIMGDRLCLDDMQGQENHEGGRIINGKMKYARREEGEGGEMRRQLLVDPEYFGNYFFLY